uniref:Uncharacterized protein n=1 Tax=viral metagenome TaxID=1070528 RepID=A0A6M3MCL3_9ZZZZ
MSIVQLRKRIDTIALIRFAQSKEGDREVQKMSWQLEQLTGREQIDSLDDIKDKMERKRKALKKRKKR